MLFVLNYFYQTHVGVKCKLITLIFQRLLDVYLRLMNRVSAINLFVRGELLRVRHAPLRRRVFYVLPAN